jgi:amino acid adenylation domain-containing protein
MFVVRNALEQSARLPGVEQEPILTDRGTAKFDVTFFATETPAGLRLSLEYCTDLFERDTARRMLEHYRVLLEAALADPAQRVSELRLLGGGEERRVLYEWNETAADLAGAELPIHEAVTAQARTSPGAVAVSFRGAELTYRELDGSANRLARHLRSLGVGRDVPVAICADRSIDTVVAVLAVLKAGGAYVPVDPGYPAERVAFMLEDCGAPVLVTRAEVARTLPPHGASTVLLDDERTESDAPLEIETSLDDLAYVIYTSGSTGRPKGVAMPHRPLANLLAWQREQWRGRRPARTLQFASLSFDVAFQELFSTWTSGGTLVLVDDDVRRDSAALLEHLAKQRVERLFLPFVALDNLCEAAEYVGASVPALREVITAGEQLKVTAAIRGFFARHDRCTLVNQYGPTETHVVTAHDVVGPAAEWPELPPIGRPIANARAYVLDPHRRPVPVGVPGELWIGGVSVARGYLGRADLTSQRFTADPFAPEAGRMYATGDVVRLGPDGVIEYLGRTDHQAKIRGFRVEPGEVEAALRAHPAVREAFATVRDDGGEKRLVAFVIGNRRQLESAELREFLRRRLPEYMVPAAVATVDAFPLTPNGKIDRDRLARLPLPEEKRDAEYVAPRSAVEAQLAALWQKLLGVERVGVTDDFFELGGHSLLAVKLFSEIERKLGLRLPLSSLFETTTVAGLAELVEAERVEARPFSTTLELRPGNGEVPLFLIAWAGGEVLPYRDLVENLDPRIPVYGLRARGIDRRNTPLSTVEEIADYYVEEVRRIQPHGPYRLAGFCFSGIVAYEMARRLTAAGEEVSTLALIDSYPWRPRRRRTLLTAGREQAKAFRTAGREGRREWLSARLNGIRARLYRLLYLRYGPPLYAKLEARGWQSAALRGPWNPVLIASNLARRRYVPNPLDVRVQWFRAQQAPEPRPTPWDELADVENHPIVAPGISHSSMMREPHVKLLVDALAAELGAPPAAS